MGAVPRRHREICADPAARRQQGRRRHAVADGAGPARAEIGQGQIRAARPRHDRGIAVLWRRTADAGDLGALGGRRPRGGGAAARHLCRAAHGHHPHRPVRHSVAGHGHGRLLFRADHDDMVHRAGRHRPHAHRRRSRRAQCLQPGLRRRLPEQEPADRAGHARRRVPCRDRRRSALRRSRPFRAEADPDRVAVLRAARLGDQLSRPGVARPLRPLGGGQPVLPHGAAMGALSDDRPRHRSDGDREPGGDHRRLLPDQPGGSARHPAAASDQAHLGDPGRADLHSPGQGAVAGRHAAPRRHVPLLRGARFGLWRRRRRHHARRWDHGVHGDLAGMEVGAVGAHSR